MPFISSIRKKYDNISKTNILDHLEITGGDEIYTAGGYRIHLFTKTGDSEFKIKARATNNTSLEYQQLITEGAVDIDYLIIAGGGAGATNLAGGGGAGGYLEGKANLAVGATAPTSVGAGSGPSAPGSRYAVGGNGSNSVFNGITATGGGGGGGGPSHHAGGGGGGAGAAGRNATMPSPIGGQYGTGIIGQGHPGGRGGGHIHTAGQGGSGLSSTITGSNVVRGGGGGGSGYPSSPGTDRGHPGGAGGGGKGYQTDINLNGDTGATNTGGGGGSGSHYGRHGGGGGPGIVVVRYRV
jgi:hypothetical protein